MEIKILQVFFDSNGLPYKDKERTIHFPIIGSGFQGASNTTKIRFYYGELGDSATSWVATSKLPNGKIGSKILSTYLDSDLDESYALLELSSFYFQYKGDVFISLQGYEGGVQVEYDSVHEIYKIVGTPTIQATGSIKLSVNYATQFVGSGEESNVDLQSILALIGEKANDDDVVHKAGTETITGAKTFTGTTTFTGGESHSGTVQFSNSVIINNFGGAGGILNLSYTYLTTNSKTYFARVGVTTNQYVYYDLPKNYSDLGSEQHLTLATEDYVDNSVSTKADDDEVVHLAGSETITGEKTFSLPIYANDGVYTKGITVSSDDSNYIVSLNTDDYPYFYLSNGSTPLGTILFPTISGGVTETLATEDYVTTQIASAISNVYKIQAPKTVAELNALTLSSSMVGYVYNVTTSGTLTAGSVTVIAGDNVVVVESGGSYIFDKLAATIDLSNYVTLDGTQTITGAKTFSNGIKIGTSSNANIYENLSALVLTSQTGEIKIYSLLRPYSNNAYDLGTSSYKWKDLYLSGKVYSGNTIAGITLNGDITAQALTDALVLANNTDIDNLF